MYFPIDELPKIAKCLKCLKLRYSVIIKVNFAIRQIVMNQGVTLIAAAVIEKFCLAVSDKLFLVSSGNQE